MQKIPAFSANHVASFICQKTSTKLIVGAEWYQNRQMVKRSFAVIDGKLAMEDAPDTLLLNFDYFQSSDFLFNFTVNFSR